jgi:hypothetical protein
MRVRINATVLLLIAGRAMLSAISQGRETSTTPSQSGTRNYAHKHGANATRFVSASPQALVIGFAART